MADLKARILEIIQKPQLSGFATMTADGKPWVRYVMAMADETMVLRFATFVDARKVNQIEVQPEVHLTAGVNSPMDMKPYVQIQGRAQFTVDKTVRHAFWNPMLAPIFSGPDDPQYGIIEVTPYRIELCTPGSYDPEVWVAKAE